MPTSIQTTVIGKDRTEIILADAPESEAAKLWIQVVVSQATNRDMPLAVLQAIALRNARDAISEQIQAITQTHGPVP